MMNEECLQDCLQIIERVVEFGDGKLVGDRTRLVALILSNFIVPKNIPDDIRSRLSLEQWEEVRSNFALGLVQALDIFERDARSQYRN
jgi:hypothetical protein